MEGYRVSTKGWVLRVPSKTSPTANTNVANTSLAKEGCTEWPLKVPLSSAILLTWLLKFNIYIIYNIIIFNI